MTVSCDFFDHIKYPALNYLNRFADFVTNGVLHLTDFTLSYPSTPNMTVNVGAGTAWVNGYRIANDSNPVTLTFAAANGSNPRIDLVEVGWSGSGLTGTGVLNVVTGTPAGTPLQPQPSAGCIGLFAVRVNANQTQITAGSVTDLRVAMTLAGAVTTPLATVVPGAESAGTTGAVGVSTNAARQDHIHSAPGTWPPTAHESNHLTGGTDPIPVATTTTDGLMAHTDKAAIAAQGMIPSAVDTGVANAYVVTLSPAPTAYTDMMGLAVKITNTSTGASTINVNGLGAKTIVDGYGNAITSGGLVAGIIYTLRYNATTGNFIAQGKGGGNATASQLLLNQTATVNGGQITGTMPNNPSPTATITTENGQVVVPAGYSPGGTITALLANFAAAVIAAGQTVGGILGTFTSGATATAAGMLAGLTAYVNGVLVTGTMPENGSQNPAPGGTIPAGYTTGGTALSCIASIQYGTVTITGENTSGTATISSVNTASSIVIPLGFTIDDNNIQYGLDMPVYTLTNSTTVTVTIHDTSYSATKTFNFVVIQFNGVEGVQTGTITLSSATSGTATISSINTAKSLLIVNGWYNSATETEESQYPSATLTNSTTVTVTTYASTTLTLAFTVITFD